MSYTQLFYAILGIVAFSALVNHWWDSVNPDAQKWSWYGPSCARYCLYVLSLGFASGGMFMNSDTSWIMLTTSSIIILAGWFIGPIAQVVYKSKVYTGFALGMFLAVTGLYLIGVTDQKFLGWTTIVVGLGVAFVAWPLWQFVTNRLAEPPPAPTKS